MCWCSATSTAQLQFVSANDSRALLDFGDLSWWDGAAAEGDVALWPFSVPVGVPFSLYKFDASKSLLPPEPDRIESSGKVCMNLCIRSLNEMRYVFGQFGRSALLHRLEASGKCRSRDVEFVYNELAGLLYHQTLNSHYLFWLSVTLFNA